QETFLQFCEGHTRFLGKSAPFTYLYRVATNLSIDRLRRRKTAGVRVDIDDADPPAADNPGAAAAGSEELLHLPRDRDAETLTIAIMAHFDGLTQDEIAAALDLSRRTIGKRLKQFLALTRAKVGD